MVSQLILVGRLGVALRNARKRTRRTKTTRDCRATSVRMAALAAAGLGTELASRYGGFYFVTLFVATASTETFLCNFVSFLPSLHQKLQKSYDLATTNITI